MVGLWSFVLTGNLSLFKGQEKDLVEEEERIVRKPPLPEKAREEALESSGEGGCLEMGRQVAANVGSLRG